MPDLDDATPEDIAHGASEFILYMEEIDSQECVYTWHGLMAGTVLLYDFSGKDYSIDA